LCLFLCPGSGANEAENKTVKDSRIVWYNLCLKYRQAVIYICNNIPGSGGRNPPPVAVDDADICAGIHGTISQLTCIDNSTCQAGVTATRGRLQLCQKAL
jgi:hypothetical protein